jgi:hypothetical protein
MAEHTRVRCLLNPRAIRICEVFGRIHRDEIHRAFIARSLPFVIVRCCPQTGSDLP